MIKLYGHTVVAGYMRLPGNSDASIFVGQPQVRYSFKSISLAIDNPESRITSFGGG
jgi:hypothetical protein